MSDELTVRLRKASSAVYLATDAAVADDLSAMLKEAASLIESLKPEFLFVSPQPGLYYVTRNGMLAEVMHAAQPDVPMLVRLAPPYPESVL